MIDLSEMAVRALVFDCDGTLAETAPLHYQAMAGALRAQGHAITRSWYDERVGLSRHDLFREYERSHEVTVDIEAASRSSREIFSGLVCRARPVSGTMKIVRRYHGKLPMVVASGGERNLVRATLSAIDAVRYFSHVVTICDVSEGKPAPHLFLEAARRLGVAAQDCLVFEDSEEGIEAARRAGMQVVHVHEIGGMAQQ